MDWVAVIVDGALAGKVWRIGDPPAGCERRLLCPPPEGAPVPQPGSPAYEALHNWSPYDPLHDLMQPPTGLFDARGIEWCPLNMVREVSVPVADGYERHIARGMSFNCGLTAFGLQMQAFMIVPMSMSGRPDGSPGEGEVGLDAWWWPKILPFGPAIAHALGFDVGDGLRFFIRTQMMGMEGWSGLPQPTLDELMEQMRGERQSMERPAIAVAPEAEGDELDLGRAP